jgi:hypothetical protein
VSHKLNVVVPTGSSSPLFCISSMCF